MVRFEAQKIALDKAETATNLRLEGLNEWRAQNKDERACLMTRVEYEAKHQLLLSKVEASQKIIYMGLGALATIQFILKFFV